MRSKAQRQRCWWAIRKLIFRRPGMPASESVSPVMVLAILRNYCTRCTMRTSSQTPPPAFLRCLASAAIREFDNRDDRHDEMVRRGHVHPDADRSSQKYTGDYRPQG